MGEGEEVPIKKLINKAKTANFVTKILTNNLLPIIKLTDNI